MKKKIVFLFFVFLAMIARAYDFEVNGIGYNIVSIADKSVCVSGITTGGDIVIPDNVMYNNYTFKVDSLSNLFDARRTTSIKFNSLIKADGYRLYGSGTAYFYVDESNPYMKAVNGVLYNKDMTRLISFPMYRSIEEFTIPESVLSIDDYSFGANKYICKLIFNGSSDISRDAAVV